MTEQLNYESEPPVIPTVDDLRHQATEIDLGYLNNADFERNRRRRLGPYQVLFEAVSRGSLSAEEGAAITSTLHAATDLETEIDARTGLYKDKVLERRLREALRYAALTNGIVSVGFVDLDDFGLINKNFTQTHGDAALEKVGEYLKRYTRDYDTVGRCGGEEIIIVMPEIDELRMKKRLTGLFNYMPEYVADALSATGFSVGQRITASVGVAQIKFDNQNPSGSDLEGAAKELITLANRRMKVAKEDGKNRIYGTQEELAFRRDVYTNGRTVKGRRVL